jgi:hypothetical protein
MGNQKEKRKGYGKLLDAWVPPENAGDPIGCIATSFTFSPVFFEEECLGRFLQLESDPTEDGPLYLLEREEKLSQVACAGGLVDQHHCQGIRSLRWDLLPVRMPAGVFHAKVSLLHWSSLLRIIISSANLTEDGYRRNQEIFGTVDFSPELGGSISILDNCVRFLREGLGYSQETDENSGVQRRWHNFLTQALDSVREWAIGNKEGDRKNIQTHLILSGPNFPNAIGQLEELWQGPSPPIKAHVFSPFYDPPEAENQPARSLWGILRRRGEAGVNYYVTTEELPGDQKIQFVHAPESLKKSQPHRPSVSTKFFRLSLEPGRPLHAKGIWLEDERWAMYLMGSSNFTTAGLGLGATKNMEANLLYVVDGFRDSRTYSALKASFPEGDRIGEEFIKWKPIIDEGVDSAGDQWVLPRFFGSAVYDCDEKKAGLIRLAFSGPPPMKWGLFTEDHLLFFERSEWESRGSPVKISLPWKPDRPPSGFFVKWDNPAGQAWWPVNVDSTTVLPPVQELKDLPLEMLIDILTSARPLHQAMRRFLKTRDLNDLADKKSPELDPLRRVDSSGFLLQRTRRVSWALNALRKRIERPAPTRECLEWRIRGPIGVMAVARAITREAKSDEEKAFLLAELALELWRAKPCDAPGCMSAEKMKEEILSVITDLRSQIPSGRLNDVGNLKDYVDSVFAAILERI